MSARSRYPGAADADTFSGHVPLTIDDLRFEVASATLSGALADPHWCDTYNGGRGKALTWYIAVTAVSRDVDGEVWAPQLERDGIVHSMTSWHQLESLRVSWDTPWDARTAEPNGGFYVFEHEDILRAEIALGPRARDCFRLGWSGGCTIGWGKYGDDVPFHLETDVVFDGIRVQGSERDDDQALIERLRRCIAVDDLVPQPLKRRSARYQDGVRMCEQTFLPRLA